MLQFLHFSRSETLFTNLSLLGLEGYLCPPQPDPNWETEPDAAKVLLTVLGARFRLLSCGEVSLSMASSEAELFTLVRPVKIFSHKIKNKKN